MSAYHSWCVTDAWKIKWNVNIKTDDLDRYDNTSRTPIYNLDKSSLTVRTAL